jgi:ribosome-binding protein aMBF1 (putative translation factor)
LRFTRSQLNRALGDAIAEARETAGLSQRELSARIDRSEDFIGKIERYESTLQNYDLVRIAYALDITAAELMASAEKRL